MFVGIFLGVSHKNLKYFWYFKKRKISFTVQLGFVIYLMYKAHVREIYLRYRLMQILTKE